MTTLTFADLSYCDELDHTDAQSVRGGSSCFRRENPLSCHDGKPPGCGPSHYNPWPPLHFGCGPVYTPGCHSEPGRIVPL